MSKFWPVLIALQILACTMLLLIFGSELTSPIRNPEAGMAAVLVGIPLVIGQVIGAGLLYLYRNGLPEKHRDKILLFSVAMMILAPAILLLAMQGS